MKRVVDFTRTARLESLEIFDYLNERSPSAAVQFLDDLHRCATHLTRFPHLGHVSGFGKKSPTPLRVTRVSPIFDHYLVFYRVHARTIRIARIVHGSRDLNSLLKR